MGVRMYGLLLLASLTFLALSGCASAPTHSIPASTPVQTSSAYTVGGTVSGLSGGPVVLAINGGNSLTVNANGSFTFATPIAAGDAWMVTVLTQPAAQSCTVRNPGGVANANVSTIQVACASMATAPIATASGQWTWAGGSSLANIAGSYGERGSPAPGNAPGARTGTVGWTDPSGNLWLFGGTVPVGSECATTHALCWTVSDDFDDLWEFNGSQWAWRGGSIAPDQAPAWGTKGAPAAGNDPGSRSGAASWTDPSGNFWLFGGESFNQNNVGTMFNDLWKYAAGQWTWVSGSSTPDAIGVYGTLGQPAPGNAPGARSSAVTWTDPAGNLWLFGGSGGDSAACCEEGGLNDLWKFSNGQWAWMSGSSVGDQQGVYGTLGASAAANVPGGRQGAVGWTDASGNLWLFGGYGFAGGAAGPLNDLWEYTGGQWTWKGGSNVVRQSGVYGVQGVPAPGNIPGARESAVSWTDPSGNFWLFGGLGYDSAGNSGDLNDLWKYSGGQWTWVSGSKLANQNPVYGTLGAPAPGNIPGARDSAQTWIDASGNLWLFGGNGLDSTGTAGQLNDLWVFRP